METKELLERAGIEIESLRRRVELLDAQMGVVQVFAAALGLRQSGGAMSPDIVWEIQQKLRIMENAEKTADR
jgi:hypothetical protein